MLDATWLEMLLSQMWQVTILCVVARWLDRVLFRERPYWSYQLWGLVVLKSVTPPLWASHCGVFSWLFHRLTEHTLVAWEMLNGSTFSPKYVAGALAFVWVCGAGIRITQCVSRWRQFQRQTELEQDIRLLHLVQQLASNLQVPTPRLRISQLPIGPAVFGWWQPTIVLPQALASLPSNRLRPMLAHELMHVQRRDTLTAMIGWGVQTVWWFFPPVHQAIRAWTEAGELCCDRDTLRLCLFSRRDYASALLDVLDSRVQPLTGTPNLQRDQITTRRVYCIMQAPLQRPARQRVLLAFAMACLLFLPGSSCV